MFKIGEEYLRPQLLDFVGSKQLVSGMIFGDKEPTCIIVTSGGKHGKEAGYNDERNYDGSWQYIGQGSSGDQNPYSKVNAYLTNGERTVLFFSTREPNSSESRNRGSRQKFYKFEGCFEVGSWQLITPSEGKRADDKLVQYHLIPADNVFIEGTDSSQTLIVKESNSFYGLREKLKNQKSKPPRTSTINTIEYRIRSLQVKEYALERAKGICEYCGKVAPFTDYNDIPFLEVHHILKLADDGPDAPENVAAICPNCHREAHYGKNRDKLNDELLHMIEEKETQIDKAI